MPRDNKKDMFIEGRYGFSFVAWFLGLMVLFFGSFSVILFILLNKRLGIDYLTDVTTLSNLQGKLPVILTVTGIVQATVASFVVFFITLFLAHAVAGPLVRFRKYLRMVGRDEPIGGISFRKSDQLQYLAEVFREMQDQRTKRRSQMSLYGQQVQDLIAEYESLVKDPTGSFTALEEKRGALKEIYQKMLALLPEEKRF